MIVQGRDTPSAPHHPTPRPSGGGRPKGHQKKDRPAAHKPSKPASPRPHKPSRPAKPAARGKRTAGRGEVELTWFGELEFAPLAKAGHIH